MNAFSSDWLALREPLDHQARNRDVLEEVVRHVDDRTAITITDIAGGTGSTLRALDGRLNAKVNWQLIDNDPNLINHASTALAAFAPTIHAVDLSGNIESIFTNQPDLITTSAFLDLVSLRWFDEFASLLRAHAIPFYAAITYNGQKSLEPRHPLDSTVFELFDAHQQTDKGFGPAMGPKSAELIVERLRKTGFHVVTGISDWFADKEHSAFQRELINGWYQAALELKPQMRVQLDEWLAFRKHEINENHSELTVGHIDCFAVPV